MRDGANRSLREKVFVVDLRKPEAKEALKKDNSPVVEKIHEGESATSGRSPRSADDAELRVPVRSISFSKDLPAGTRTEGPSNAVPEHFQETLRSEFVRRAGIIVRDGGGELRLILKPESLGSVRINLNLSGNHIEGRIIVENNTVKEMFESQLTNLSQAFKEDGFESTALEVAVGGRQGRRSSKEPDPRLATRKFEDNSATVEQTTLGEWLINLTA
jgi:flagellar hook-length control protein FliK